MATTSTFNAKPYNTFFYNAGPPIVIVVAVTGIRILAAESTAIDVVKGET